MRQRFCNGSRTTSKGVVLLLAMIFMVMLAAIAASLLQSAVLEIHMAGNEQFQEEAYQHARAIATELSVDRANFHLAGGANHINCARDDHYSDCNLSALSAPISSNFGVGMNSSYRISRQEPLIQKNFPLRESQVRATSARYFDVAVFEIDVRVAGSRNNLGNARVVRGVAVRLASQQ